MYKYVQINLEIFDITFLLTHGHIYWCIWNIGLDTVKHQDK